MSRYTHITDDDRRAMLAEIGVERVEDLFADVPEGVRLDRALDLPDGLSEQEVYLHLKELAELVVSRGVHPHSRDTLRSMSAGWGTSIEEVALRDGATDAQSLAAAVDEDTAAVFLQQPNYLGAVEDVAALAEAAKRTGAVLVCA